MSGYKYGKRSLTKLNEAEPVLKELFIRALWNSPEDIAVIEGHRTKEDQDKAFKSGNSKVKWPHSKHNKLPSQAVDAVPYPIDWGNRARFESLAEHIKSVWAQMESEGATGDWLLQWGGNFKSFYDGPHWQIVKK
jgi:peptidoglycan L-alanyl-D-glutamate endopeptidase CwlK